MIKNNQKQTITAPQPILTSSSSLPANRVISVQLSHNEGVEWVWTSLPDGTKYVSGYKITKK